MENIFKIQGIIVYIGVVFFPVKGKDFCKREFILEVTDEQNIKHLMKFTLINNQINHITNHGVGYEISFSFGVSCKPWVDKDGNHQIDKHGNKFYFQDLVPCYTEGSDFIFTLIKIHEDRVETKKIEGIPAITEEDPIEDSDLPF